ncbi:hypothetical protein FRC03_006525 [Tulasnella sp. 419]|nr:hypothetical protein FRC03_006525 [Tulasnella sp. 419]
MSSSTTDSPSAPRRPQIQDEWKAALASLPDPSEREGRIPAFYFAHGQPLLAWPKSVPIPGGRFRALYDGQGPDSPLAHFLKDFGKTLLKKYNPKAILVFSAHWESSPQIYVSNYDENPLYYDYYGFNKELYELQFSSKGSSTLSETIVNTLQKAGISARLFPTDEPRGRDGLGGKGYGFDHGVFVPFKLMFGDSIDVPVVEVSIDESLSTAKNWELGKALNELRSQGVLILSGGLTVHTFQDFDAFSEKTAAQIYHDWDEAVLQAVEKPPNERKEAMNSLLSHPGFRKAHPREEHFIPIYVAAGAGESGESRILASLYGAPTVAFGI